jgi:aspartate beta-hydroxylase
MTSHVEAQQLLRQGRIADAARAFEAILEQAPQDQSAINALVLIALNQRNGVRAMELLQRVPPAEVTPITAHQLGLAYQLGGDMPAALRCLRQAIALAPDFHLARLHLGQALEASGAATDAAVQYARTLQDAQRAGRWTNESTTAPALRPEVTHAVRYVRAHRRRTAAALFEPLAAKYGAASLDRVQECLSIHLNEKPAPLVDPRQQPVFLFFPGLPTAAYFDRSLFPWIAALEGQTDAIVKELHDVLGGADGKERVFTSDELERQNLRGLDVAPSWNGYYFYRHGERREDNCAACPATAAALDALPLGRVRDHGPEVLFSVFTPGTHLLPHRGVTNVRSVAHLPLIIPRDCALRVGGEIHAWRTGEVVVFDDTFEHEAWNRSEQTRVVLIFDIWNPYLTEVECAAMSELIVDIGEFRQAVEAA